MKDVQWAKIRVKITWTLKDKKRTKYFFPKASANKECRSGYTFP